MIVEDNDDVRSLLGMTINHEKFITSGGKVLGIVLKSGSGGASNHNGF
jgi:hypothetical protein